MYFLWRSSLVTELVFTHNFRTKEKHKKRYKVRPQKLQSNEMVNYCVQWKFVCGMYIARRLFKTFLPTLSESTTNSKFKGTFFTGYEGFLVDVSLMYPIYFWTCPVKSMWACGIWFWKFKSSCFQAKVQLKWYETNGGEFGVQT